MRSRFRVVLMLGVLASSAMLAAEAPAAAPRPLSGKDAWAAMLGNTISGTTPDGDYSEFYNPDGTVVHVDRDGRLAGRWSLREDSVCFIYPEDDAMECRQPQLDGREGAFTDVDGTRYPFRLLTGNPNGF